MTELERLNALLQKTLQGGNGYRDRVAAIREAITAATPPAGDWEPANTGSPTTLNQVSFPPLK